MPVCRLPTRGIRTRRIVEVGLYVMTYKSNQGRRRHAIDAVSTSVNVLSWLSQLLRTYVAEILWVVSRYYIKPLKKKRSRERQVRC